MKRSGTLSDNASRKKDMRALTFEELGSPAMQMAPGGVISSNTFSIVSEKMNSLCVHGGEDESDRERPTNPWKVTDDSANGPRWPSRRGRPHTNDVP